MVQSQTELLTTKEQAAERTCYQLEKSMSVMIVMAVLRRKWFALKRDDPHKTDGAQEYFGYIYPNILSKTLSHCLWTEGI